jgi:hypothetical protein
MPATIETFLETLAPSFASSVVNHELLLQFAGDSLGFCGLLLRDVSLLFDIVQDALSAIYFSLRILKLQFVKPNGIQYANRQEINWKPTSILH